MLPVLGKAFLPVMSAGSQRSMPLHQRIHGAKLRFHSRRCWPDSDERARSCDLLREVALKIRAARMGFVSSGRIETARDKCARFGAINQRR
jgi:hypothetical protein